MKNVFKLKMKKEMQVSLLKIFQKNQNGKKPLCHILLNNKNYFYIF